MITFIHPREVPEEKSQWFDELLGDISWPQFEATDKGDLTILGTKFSMRLGLFMAMPTQAIIVEDNFLKMKQRKDLDGKGLMVLDAEAPDKCLYAGRWNPFADQNIGINEMLRIRQQYLAQAQQAALQNQAWGAQQQYSLQGVGTSNNTLWPGPRW